MLDKLKIVLDKINVACRGVNDENVALICDIIFNDKRVETDDPVINYYMGVSCYSRTVIISILYRMKIGEVDKSRRFEKIIEIFERNGNAALSCMYKNICYDMFDNDDVVLSILDKQCNEMIGFYGKALLGGNSDAMIRLGNIAGEPFRSKCLMMAYSLGNPDAMYQIGQQYGEANLFNLEIICYKEAIALGHMKAAYALGLTYKKLGNVSEMIKSFVQAAEMGSVDAMLSLYQFDKANLCHLENAIKMNHFPSMHHLAIHYDSIDDHWNALRYFVKGIVKEDDYAKDKIYPS